MNIATSTNGKNALEEFQRLVRPFNWINRRVWLLLLITDMRTPWDNNVHYFFLINDFHDC